MLRLPATQSKVSDGASAKTWFIVVQKNMIKNIIPPSKKNEKYLYGRVLKQNFMWLYIIQIIKFKHINYIELHKDVK